MWRSVVHSFLWPALAASVQAQTPRHLNVPFDYYTLPNGLKVVLSRDTTAPTVGVGVYYHVGFRNEPRDRTGPARKVSLRSRAGGLDCSAIARERGGGGHPGAAGFSSDETLEQITAFLEAAVGA